MQPRFSESMAGRTAWMVFRAPVRFTASIRSPRAGPWYPGKGPGWRSPLLHQQFHWPPGLFHGADHGLYGLPVCHVCLDGHGLETLCLELARQGLRRLPALQVS